nr:uncharacterized protein LOC118879427 [Drosophila suzukii]
MNNLPIILAAVQQQNLKLNQLLLAANSEEWNDDELDLYESIFSAKEQMPRRVWMLKRYGTFWRRTYRKTRTSSSKRAFVWRRGPFRFWWTDLVFCGSRSPQLQRLVLNSIIRSRGLQIQIYLCKHRLCWALQLLHYISKVEPGKENCVFFVSSRNNKGNLWRSSSGAAYWGLCL